MFESLQAAAAATRLASKTLTTTLPTVWPTVCCIQNSAASKLEEKFSLLVSFIFKNGQQKVLSFQLSISAILQLLRK